MSAACHFWFVVENDWRARRDYKSRVDWMRMQKREIGKNSVIGECQQHTRTVNFKPNIWFFDFATRQNGNIFGCNETRLNRYNFHRI